MNNIYILYLILKEIILIILLKLDRSKKLNVLYKVYCSKNFYYAKFFTIKSLDSSLKISYILEENNCNY